MLPHWIWFVTFLWGICRCRNIDTEIQQAAIEAACSPPPPSLFPPVKLSLLPVTIEAPPITPLIFRTDNLYPRRRLKIQWNPRLLEDGDQINVYRHEPTFNPTEPEESVPSFLLKNADTYVTNLSLSIPELRNASCGAFGCTWAAIIRQGHTEISDHLQVHPNWIRQFLDSDPFARSITLEKLLIPGTRDSSAFEVLVDGADDFKFTQDLGIFGQLMAGARYLELWVKYYPESVQEDEFWAADEGNHEPLHPISWAVHDIVKFLELTKELVLLHIRGFVDFSPSDVDEVDRHERFIKRILSDVGKYLVVFPSPSLTSTLSLGAILKEDNGSLIVMYNHRFHAAHPKLWPGIPVKERHGLESDCRSRQISWEDTPYDELHPWVHALSFTPPLAARIVGSSDEGLRGHAFQDQRCRVFENFLSSGAAVYLSISSKYRERYLELNWYGATPHPGDAVLLTSAPPVPGKPFGDKALALAYPSNTTANVGVYLSIGAQFRERFVELNWYGMEPQQGDFVTLETEPPGDIDDGVALVRFSPATTSKRFELTNVQFPFIDHKAEDLIEGACQLYWIAYWRNEELFAWNCLQIHPHWMQDLLPDIGAMTLRDIFIPGTHDTGAYWKASEYPPYAFDYVICHEENIYEQLVYGNRYLDMRAAKFTNIFGEDEYWIVHGIPIHKMQVGLDDIKKFLMNTEELVIFDVYFKDNLDTDEEIEKFYDFMKLNLGDFMTPKALRNAPLSQLLNQPQKLIVVWNDESTEVLHDDLWPSIVTKWGDKNDPFELKNYLESVAGGAENIDDMYVVAAEMTPTELDVILDLQGDLRQMSDAVNRNVTEWYREDWGSVTNAIKLDFFQGTDIINIAIDINRQKGRKYRQGKRPWGSHPVNM
ncbi:unnamed protein product [Cyprideis torosa]|uniref:Uncharacterized protein n=1 Tax=Cyprideis torosa TaxID=163714 RepID=A0A7R8ZKD4_9CRUS|nr:unnamed protein product [Cyprideis torosa]CAG0881517.1 unnamed protein product [Cyprideis torosa]